MPGILFIGGEGPSREKYDTVISRFQDEKLTIVAADSGADLAFELDVKPDYIVGDMDSIVNTRLLEELPVENIIIHPEDKDETDTEIGISLLEKLGFNRIILVGGGKGRLDHTIALLRVFERIPSLILWLTKKEEIYRIEKSFEVKGWKGNTVSLFPISERAEDMHSEGLKWKLDGHKWRRTDFGVSNIVTADVLYISIENGKLLLIRNNAL